jgi:hypothetical protein
MKLTPVSTSWLCKGGQCPTIYKTESGAFVVQGRLVSLSECEGLSMIPSHEALVEIPRDLIEQFLPKGDE